MASGFATPAYWLVMAADAQAVAESMTDWRSREQMMMIARGYQRLAEHAKGLERLNLPMERSELGSLDD
jgi:hypothetical protein